MRKMLEILSQVLCWKERVDQMSLLVGGARSTASCGYWSEPLHQGAGPGLPARWKPGRLQVGQNEDHAFEMLSGQRGKLVLVCLPEM